MSFEDIDKALDIETTPIKSEIVKTEPIAIKKSGESPDQLQKDYEYSRGQLYSIIEKGQEAINGILELAQESDSPRAYEVAGHLLKTLEMSQINLLTFKRK